MQIFLSSSRGYEKDFQPNPKHGQRFMPVLKIFRASTLSGSDYGIYP